MISGIQFDEKVIPNIMQYRGNYTKVKRVPSQSSPLCVENVGKFYSTWNPGIIFISQQTEL
jgi:hypothetical protein